ncbi:MAG: phosphatase PAP2 family protein [Candidatus Woesearchaeota archaeon]|jgi:membrane-associated phospholipid phosphatase
MKKIIEEIYKQITNLGGIIPYGLIILTSLLLDEYKLFLELSLSLLIVILIGFGIKELYFVDRPQKQKHHNLLEKLDASSFPSIHSARIISLAIILSIHFNKLFFTLFLIILAILVMYSRIYLKKHRFVDIIGGTILGASSCLILLFI